MINQEDYENRISDISSLELIDPKDYNSIEELKNKKKKEQEKKLEKMNYLSEMFEKDYDDRVLGAFFGYFCGDAKGVPYEFIDREKLGSIPHEMIGNVGVHNQDAGTFSDDSSTTLATMDSIIQTKNIDYDLIMSNLLHWYSYGDYTATGEVFDVGITTKQSLEKYKKGVKYKDCGSKSFNSNGNGSLMRMLPIALLFETENEQFQNEYEIVYYTSGLTHSHTISLAGCKIYCDIVKELVDGSSMLDALDSIKDNHYEDYYEEGAYYYSKILNGRITQMNEDEIKSSGFIVDTLEASIWSVLNTDSLEEAIQLAISLGGDTDTIAAITGSLAGLIYGYESIPADWIASLKKKEYLEETSRDFLKALKEIKKNDVKKI